MRCLGCLIEQQTCILEDIWNQVPCSEIYYRLISQIGSVTILFLSLETVLKPELIKIVKMYSLLITGVKIHINVLELFKYLLVFPSVNLFYLTSNLLLSSCVSNVWRFYF